MPYSDEPFWRNMHQETAYELFSGDSDFFPLPMVFIILGSEGNSAACHAFDPVVADSDPMGIFTKIPNYGLRQGQRHGYMSSVFTYTYIYAKGSCFTVHYVINSFSLRGREFMSFHILWIKAGKYILDCTVILHDSPPFGLSKGLRMPRRLLLLSWMYTSVDLGSMCPSSAWIYLMSAPSSNRWLAKLCRQQ